MCACVCVTPALPFVVLLPDKTEPQTLNETQPLQKVTKRVVLLDIMCVQQFFFLSSCKNDRLLTLIVSKSGDGSLSVTIPGASQ